MRRTISFSFLALFAPLAGAIFLTAFFIYQYERNLIHHDIEVTEEIHVKTAGNQAAYNMRFIIHDVRLLAQLPAVKLYTGTNSGQYKVYTTEIFEAFAVEKNVFDQVRYIDEKGFEKIRVNYSEGKARAVPEGDLAYKGDRYYFKEAMRLRDGEVFISRLDLNVESGEIERPFKPMIRFATRVKDSNGELRGVVVLNLLGELLREAVRTATSASRGKAMILNQDGYWLLSPDAGEEWGFQLPGRARFADRYPDAWNRLKSREGSFWLEGRFYTFTTVDARKELQVKHSPAEETLYGIGPWKVMTVLDNPDVRLLMKFLETRITLGAMVSVLIAMIFSYWYLRSRYRADLLAQESLSRGRTISEKQGLLDLFISNVPAAVAMLDRDMRFIAYSRRWLEDYELGEGLLHKQFFSVFPHAPAEWREIFQHCLAGERHRHDEDTLTRPDGGQSWVFWEAHPWYNAQGEVGGLVMLMEDITTQKQAQLIRDEFIAKVSHELRTPLTSIIGSVRLLQKHAGTTPDEDTAKLVDIAARNADRLIQLVDDLLDIQKSKLGKMHFEMVPVDFGKLVKAVLDALELSAIKAGTAVRLENHAPDCMVFCDPGRIGQVVTNLLSNALKFAPAGTGISLEIARVPEGVILSVMDAGPGVPQDFLSQLFSDFAQADSGDRRNPGGSGLGLAISRAIIERHDGKIGYEPMSGGGSRFYFILPEYEARS